MMRLKLFSLCLFLAGCATAKTANDYHSPTASPETVSKDEGACEMAAKNYAAGAGWAVYNSWYNTQFDSCMRSKGYSRGPASISGSTVP
jgi:hypothetical protein